MVKILALLLGCIAMSQAQAAASSEAATLTVAAVQMRSSHSLAENLSRITNAIYECARKSARVVVFPECALSGYFGEAVMKLSAEQLAAAQQQVAQACRAAGMYAVVGSAWRDGEKLFNSALVFSPAGQVIERYHKIHLVESWPQAGDHLSVFQIEGVPCSVIICHDERYPELVRLPVLAGAKVIFYLSSESGLHEESKLGPYRAQIQARAVENTVYVIQANAPANKDATGSHGQSRIMAPDGNIMQEASIFQEDVLVQTLELRRATRANALNSLKLGPLRDWWQEGLKRVRIIASADAQAGK
jgi:predicted amidohydrolase